MVNIMSIKSCIAIVGGTGFIGSHFIRQFINSFSKIIAIDVRPNIKMISDVMDRYRERIEIVSGDVLELQDLIEAFKLCDPMPSQIYMLAALLPRDCERSPNRAFKVNIYGLHNVLEAARIIGTKHVIFPSSMTIYKPSKTGTVSEEDPVDPTTIYGVTKVVGEIWGIKYAQRYNMKFKVLRFPAIIGPGRADGGLAAYASLAIQKAAQGEDYIVPVSPSTKLSLIYVKDAVRALKELAERDTPHNIYNIAGVEPTPSAGEIVNAIKEFIPGALISFNPNRTYDQVISTWPERVDDSRARRDWGWEPFYKDLRNVIRDFIDEVRSLPNIYKV